MPSRLFSYFHQLNLKIDLVVGRFKQFERGLKLCIQVYFVKYAFRGGRKFKSTISSVGPKPVNEFIWEQQNKNTLSKTRREIAILMAFLKEKNEEKNEIFAAE